MSARLSGSAAPSPAGRALAAEPALAARPDLVAGLAIIDFHARLAPSADAPGRLIAALDTAGIDSAVVCAGGMIGLERLAAQITLGGRAAVTAGNDRVRDVCARSSGRLVPFFFADPFTEVTAYERRAPQFRGLEISPAVHGFRLDEPEVADLIAVATAHSHPVYVVTLGREGTRPADLAALARRHPAATFVWGHCGHTGLEIDGLSALEPVANVLAETSGCFTVTARLAIERLGSSRVLFGTEFPLQDPGVELAKYAALGLSPEALDDVLWRNARRILGLSRPGGVSRAATSSGIHSSGSYPSRGNRETGDR